MHLNLGDAFLKKFARNVRKKSVRKKCPQELSAKNVRKKICPQKPVRKKFVRKILVPLFKIRFFHSMSVSYTEVLNKIKFLNIF